MLDLPNTLLAGYRNFMALHFSNESMRYRELAELGQTPETMVIACCDSRVAPEIIFNTRPGEIFVVRNVANLVPPYEPDGEYHSTSAALEFAVQNLKVKHIIVLGHGCCGGIKAALDSVGTAYSSSDFIDKWMSLIAPAAERVAANKFMTTDERQCALERISIQHSITSLRTFPYVNILEKKGRLRLYGAWFDIATGELWIMDSESEDFVRLSL